MDLTLADQRKLQSTFRQLKSRLQSLEYAVLVSPSALSDVMLQTSTHSHNEHGSGLDLPTTSSVLPKRPHSKVRFKTNTNRNNNSEQLSSHRSSHSSLADPIRRHVAAFMDCFDEFIQRAWLPILHTYSSSHQQHSSECTVFQESLFADTQSSVDTCHPRFRPILPLGILSAFTVGRALAATSVPSQTPKFIASSNRSCSDIEYLLQDKIPDHYLLPAVFQHMFEQVVPASPTVQGVIIPHMIVICESHGADWHAFELLKRLWSYTYRPTEIFKAKLAQEHVWAWRTSTRLIKRRTWEHIISARAVSISLSLSNIHKRQLRKRNKYPLQSEMMQIVWMIAQIEVASALRVLKYILDEVENCFDEDRVQMNTMVNIAVSIPIDENADDHADHSSNESSCNQSMSNRDLSLTYDLVLYTAAWLLRLRNVKPDWDFETLRVISTLISRYARIVCHHMTNVSTTHGADTCFAILCTLAYLEFNQNPTCHSFELGLKATACAKKIIKTVSSLLSLINISAMLTSDLIIPDMLLSICTLAKMHSEFALSRAVVAALLNHLLHFKESDSNDTYETIIEQLRKYLQEMQELSSNDSLTHIEKWRFEPLLNAYILATPHPVLPKVKLPDTLCCLNDTDSDMSCFEDLSGGTPIPYQKTCTYSPGYMFAFADSHDPLTAPTSVERSMRAYVERRRSRHMLQASIMSDGTSPVKLQENDDMVLMNDDCTKDHHISKMPQDLNQVNTCVWLEHTPTKAARVKPKRQICIVQSDDSDDMCTDKTESDIETRFKNNAMCDSDADDLLGSSRDMSTVVSYQSIPTTPRQKQKRMQHTHQPYPLRRSWNRNTVEIDDLLL
ncbi:hypothetical protein QVD99_007950 [Batrachochytrium dendrobatidis]|nr:hypothetical protein QVD99_007950 [Batrachochytrium dendrobatidis]